MSEDVQIFCQSCNRMQPLEVESMAADKLNGDAIWGDLLCGTCHLVIATLTVPKAGEWEFVRTVRTTDDN